MRSVYAFLVVEARIRGPKVDFCSAKWNACGDKSVSKAKGNSAFPANSVFLSQISHIHLKNVSWVLLDKWVPLFYAKFIICFLYLKDLTKDANHLHIYSKITSPII